MLVATAPLSGLIFFGSYVVVALLVNYGGKALWKWRHRD